MLETEPDNTMTPLPPQAAPFSLRRRIQLCIAMLALESYISFEEIFMLAILQRVDVPVLFVSLPGTISSAIGVFVIPLLGWASDWLTCGTKYLGQKRPFAFWTLAVSVTGMSILVYVSSASLYNDNSDDSENTSSTASPPTDQSTNMSSSEYVTTMGLLGIVGFVLADHGYDSSMSTFKSYMIAVTPVSQHDNIFILGTLIGAVGGCITSLLGFVDLASLFPVTGAVLDRGIAQCLAQALILLTELVVLGTVSLLTGSENLAHALKDSDTLSTDYETVIDECGNINKTSEKKVAMQGDSATPSNSRYKENTPLIIDTPGRDPPDCCVRLVSFWKRWKRRILLCVMTFLGLSANYAYFVYVSNYVAEVIYEGSPTAESGGEAYRKYVEGVHVASLGMLTFYCLFVAYNVFHNKILGKIGMRAEYMAASVGCVVLMFTLAGTNNIVVFFLNAATMAVFRTAVYTIPFILSITYAREEAKEGDGNLAHSSGVAMASITAMIPGSYFVVSLVMGPLMDITGYPGTPIVIAAGCGLLGILAALLVTFE